MSTDRLVDITTRLREFSEQRDWSQFHNPKNLAMLIASEAGELLAELRWVSGDESDQMFANAEARSKIEHEIADILIGVLIFCDRTGIDPWRAIETKIEINHRNYPPNQRGMPTRTKS